MFDWESSGRSYSRSIPNVWTRGEGSYVEDAEGRRYLDLLCGAGVLLLGHRHPEVEAAVGAASSAAVTHLDMRTELESKFASELIPRLPFGKSDGVRLHFCSGSGSDAVEAALKLARICTGRQGIISFMGSYHGMSQGALAVTSKVFARERALWGPQPVWFCPYPYPRGFPPPFNEPQAAADFSLTCLRLALEDDHSGVSRPAAVILEPIQGEGGCVLPPTGFLRALRELCTRHDVLLIFDEIQCGMGRAGSWFACQQEGVSPDILCISKGVGGGYPLSLIAFPQKLDQFKGGEHIGTFRGQATALAAGLATLRHIAAHSLVERASEFGEELRRRLEALQQEFPELIAEVRGRGMLLGIEMGGTEPAVLAQRVQQRLLANGVVVETGGRESRVVRFFPPLNLRTQDADFMMHGLNRALSDVCH